MNKIITIDGPAGTGKTTITKIIGEKLNIKYFSSGTIFRAIGYKLVENNIDISNCEKVIEIIENTKIEIKKEDIIIDGIKVKNELQFKEVSEMAINIAVIEKIHTKILELQRTLFKNDSFIIEGRETGSVLFPNANVKIYLDADLETRVIRRKKQLEQININVEYDELLKEITKRDLKDKKEKGKSSLRIYDDAIYIDTTNNTINEVVKKILEKVNEN